MKGQGQKFGVGWHKT